jgi:hypothetical protein
LTHEQDLRATAIVGPADEASLLVWADALDELSDNDARLLAARLRTDAGRQAWRAAVGLFAIPRRLALDQYPAAGAMLAAMARVEAVNRALRGPPPARRPRPARGANP